MAGFGVYTGANVAVCRVVIRPILICSWCSAHVSKRHPQEHSDVGIEIIRHSILPEEKLGRLPIKEILVLRPY